MDDLGHAGPLQLRRLVEAMMGLGADLDLPVVLHRIIETAVELVDATYGALGVLDPTGTHLSQFLTIGIADDQQRAIGDLPKGHGILGLLIVHPQPIRLPDISEHPDSFGFPPNHPPMTSFLGVPLFVRGKVFGNLYLTDKRSGEVFTDVDEELAVGLASAAAVAIDNARLHARERELDLLEDRERIARDLHDTVIQRLFATGLSLQATIRLCDEPRVTARIQTAIEDLDTTVREVRAAIFELHNPQYPQAPSVRRNLLAIGSELVDVLGSEPTFRFVGPVDTTIDGELAATVVAVVREGLSNVARHAAPSRADVTLDVEGGAISLTIDDEGPGPGPPRPGGRGLNNIRARAEALGGTTQLELRSGGGTRLSWKVPLTGSGPSTLS